MRTHSATIVLRPEWGSNGGAGVPFGEASRDQRAYDRRELAKAGRVPGTKQRSRMRTHSATIVLRPEWDSKTAGRYEFWSEAEEENDRGAVKSAWYISSVAKKCT